MRHETTAGVEAQIRTDIHYIHLTDAFVQRDLHFFTHNLGLRIFLKHTSKCGEHELEIKPPTLHFMDDPHQLLSYSCHKLDSSRVWKLIM